MNPAKIRLSPKEMELLINADWILTKNGILQKARLLLEELCVVQEDTTQRHQHLFPDGVLAARAKISRGENYKGLPWLVLDHPRFFEKENVFAIRTMFWWGHFFSTTLQLSGRCKTWFESKMIRRYDTITGNDFFTCIHSSAWEHDFENGNYRLVKDMTTSEWEAHLTGKPFLKLAKKIPVSEWDNAPGYLAGVYIQLLELLED